SRVNCASPDEFAVTRVSITRQLALCEEDAMTKPTRGVPVALVVLAQAAVTGCGAAPPANPGGPATSAAAGSTTGSGSTGGSPAQTSPGGTAESNYRVTYGWAVP